MATEDFSGFFLENLENVLLAAHEPELLPDYSGFYVSERLSASNIFGESEAVQVPVDGSLAKTDVLQASTLGPFSSSYGLTGSNGDPSLMGQRNEAWRWYRHIPEVRELVNSSARLVSRVRLQVGVSDYRGRPVAFWDEDSNFNEEAEKFGVTEEIAKIITDAWEGIKDTSGTRRNLQEAIAQHWQITGETIIASWPVDINGEPYSVEYADIELYDALDISNPVVEQPYGRRFQAFPRHGVDVEMVQTSSGGEIKVYKAKFPPTGEWKILPGAELFEFINSDPQYPWEGYGWVMASLTVCRILHAGRRAEYAVTNSQIAAPPILMPSQANPRQPAVIGENPQLPGSGGLVHGKMGIESLEKLMGDTIQRALKDGLSPEQIVSRIIGMDATYIEKVRVLHELRRELDPQLAAVIENQRRHLAENAEVPPEALGGFGATNRWNGREVMEDGYRRWTWPVAQRIADMMLFVVVRPQLIAEGIDFDVVDRLVSWVDGRDAQPALDMQKLYADGVATGAVGYAGFRDFAQIPKSAAPKGPDDRVSEVRKDLQLLESDPNADRVVGSSVLGEDDSLEGWRSVYRAAKFFGLYRANAKLKTLANKLPAQSDLRAKARVFSSINLHEHIGSDGVLEILKASGNVDPDRVDLYGQVADYLTLEADARGVDLIANPDLLEYLYDSLDSQLLGKGETVEILEDGFLALVKEAKS